MYLLPKLSFQIMEKTEYKYYISPKFYFWRPMTPSLLSITNSQFLAQFVVPTSIQYNIRLINKCQKLQVNLLDNWLFPYQIIICYNYLLSNNFVIKVICYQITLCW